MDYLHQHCFVLRGQTDRHHNWGIFDPGTREMTSAQLKGLESHIDRLEYAISSPGGKKLTEKNNSENTNIKLDQD